MALEMGYLRTGVWTCLGMDLGGCPHTVTLRHKKASIHSIMTLLSTVNMADRGLGNRVFLEGHSSWDWHGSLSQPERTGMAPEAQH